MNNDPASFRMIAKTLFGLEDSLAEELHNLGATRPRPIGRAVEFEGNTETLYRVNLCSRLATRILKPLAVFKAPGPEQLYRHVSKINWTQLMSAKGSLVVDALVNDSAINNSMFAAQRTKDAIVDQFRRRFDRRPSVDPTDPDLRINLHIFQDTATLSLDASGAPLHKRGYRTEKGDAPLNEVLAAGILNLTEWDVQSHLVDGMCGSGTFVIEAALMARNIPPGILRDEFGFMRWSDFDSDLYYQIRGGLKAAIKQDILFQIVASDQNGTRIKEAKANANRAGVAGDIAFDQRPFDQLRPPTGPGVLVMNPPYGERIPVADIVTLYSTIGDCLKKQFEGYNAFLLTSNSKAAAKIGLHSSRKIKLYNGPLECRLLRFQMYGGSRKKKKQGENPA